MALRWLEGFETSKDNTHYQRFYGSLTGSMGIFDSGAIDRASRSIDSGSGFILTSKALVGSTQNTWIMGFAFRVHNGSNTIEGDSPNFNKPGVSFRNSDGEQVRLEFFDDANNGSKPGGYYYRARVVRGATTLATSDQKWQILNRDEGWVYFEWKVTIDNTTGSFSMRYWNMFGQQGIQNVTWDSASSNVDTQEQTSTGADRFQIIADNEAPANEVAWDDFYVCDSTGSKNNDFLGPIVVARQEINADGNTTDWDLMNAASTNEAWLENDLTDDDPRLTSQTTNDVHLADMTAQSYIRSVDVIGVRLDHTANRQSATGSLTLHFRWRKTTGTPAETDGDNYVVTSETWQGETDMREDDPNTGTDWVIADLDGLQVGARNGG